MNIYYTIYKTTNIVNGMIYIGRHQTQNLEDTYLGSGIDFSKALKEFGRDNFSREILFIFDDANEMLAKEAELVTPEFILLKDNYNLIPGGIGFGRTGIPHSEETKRKMSNKKLGKPLSKEHKQKISKGSTGKSHKKRILSETHRQNLSKSGKGRIFSEEHKRKISKSLHEFHDSISI